MSTIEQMLEATLAPLRSKLEECEARKEELRDEMKTLDADISRIKRVISASQPPAPAKPKASERIQRVPKSSARMESIVIETLSGSDRPMTAQEIATLHGVKDTNIVNATSALYDQGRLILAGANGGPKQNARLWALPKADRLLQSPSEQTEQEMMSLGAA